VRQPDVLRRVLGYLPQDFGVYPNLTPREFLDYLAAARGLDAASARRRIAELLELVNLTDARDRPLGGFSGGMRQRVGIAQALLNDPRLLIVDEPTGGLDPEERVRFRNLLSDLSGERIVILSTHIVSDVEATATDIAFIARGRLVRHARPEELLRSVAGRVWDWLVPSAELPAVRQRFRIGGAVRKTDGVLVRIVSAEPPGAGAVPATPSLEDAYLAAMDEASGAHASAAAPAGRGVTLRALAALARADYLERVRRHGFLVALGVTLYFAYVFLPPASSNVVTLEIAEHRGIYDSAWVGCAVAMLASTFLGLGGFFLVKNAIERDRRTGVGQILATTPISKPLYTVGKTCSNFAVLATMLALLAVGAMGMQLLRGEDRHIDLIALFAPFAIVTLPVLAVAAATAGAVRVDAVAARRARQRRVRVPVHRRHRGDEPARGRRPLALRLHRRVRGAALDDRRRAEAVAGARSESSADEHGLQLQGPRLDAAHVSAGRDPTGPRRSCSSGWTWIGIAGVIALAAAIPFDRFDTAAPARAKRRKHAAVEDAAAPDAAPAAAPAHVTLTPLAGRASGLRLLPLVRAEARLMLRGMPWPWWLIAAGLALACWLAPLPVARAWLLPFAWIWPLLLWSPLGAREAIHSTEGLVFSSPRPLARQLAATWLAGALLALAIGAGIGCAAGRHGPCGRAAAWLAGACFIPSLALACGTWTGQRPHVRGALSLALVHRPDEPRRAARLRRDIRCGAGGGRPGELRGGHSRAALSRGDGSYAQIARVSCGLQPVVLRVALLVPVVGGLLGAVGDVGDRLDVLEPELHRREQPQRRTVREWQRAAVLVRREQRLRMARGAEIDRHVVGIGIATRVEVHR
jgi:hypothetical protein